MLLGLDAASLMVPLEVRPGKHGQPCAELTPLGWVISGPVPTTTKPMKRILRVHVVDGEEDANHQLRKLWEIDSFGVRVEATTYTRSEQRAAGVEKIFYFLGPQRKVGKFSASCRHKSCII